MRKLLNKLNKETSLAVKIRMVFVAVMIVMLSLLVICVLNMWRTNERYGDMIEAAGKASNFSVDFKKDFDYETYLVIVGNTRLEESSLDRLLFEARDVVESLEQFQTSEDNAARLISAKKYLTNLETYKNRIATNLSEGNKYEENILIWENDVQIVTALIRETMLQYIYYELQDMQASRLAYNKEFTGLLIVIVTIILLVTIVAAVSAYIIPKSITKPLTRLGEVANKVAGGDLSVRADTDYGAEIGVLSESFNTMIDKVNLLLAQVTEEQIHLRQAELELLQAQINPHFLYNTLDTIVWLAEAGEQKQVVSMVRDLSDFFRTSLNQGKDTISVREELLHATSYLRIQHVRYADILEYEVDVPEEFYNYRIPKITVQPLVENALYHGIKNRRGKGKIVITGERLDESSFIIRVSDNGIGMEPERLRCVNEAIHKMEPGDEIYGLYNVNERIALRFGEAYGISIQSEYGVGTTVDIKLPCTGYENIQPTA